MLKQLFAQIIPNHIALNLARPGAILGAQRRLRKLETLPDPFAHRLAGVIQRMRRGQADDSGGVIDQIEAERAQMMNSDQVLSGPVDVDNSMRNLCSASKGRRAATLLYALLREFKPRTALELGTNLGISCAYQAAAMRVNGFGRLVTIEMATARVEAAKQSHQRLGLTHATFITGKFAETLPGVLEELAPVEYAFIDGHHQMQPTLDYFETIWPHLSDNAIVVFDDIRWSPGMQRAWRTLQADPRIRIAVDLVGVGVCVSAKTPKPDRRFVSDPISY